MRVRVRVKARVRVRVRVRVRIKATPLASGQRKRANLPKVRRVRLSRVRVSSE